MRRFSFFQIFPKDENYYIYLAYFFLLIFIYFGYNSLPNFNREEKTDYEYDGIIPKKYRKVVVYSYLIGNYDNISTFNK